MKEPLISVIVPVYNTEKYLGKCLDSIIHQTYPNLEIICVDDESSDRSGEILDEYAERDYRIKVLHRKNAGVSAARNAGLAAATGAYLAFADADDILPPDFFSLLYTKARQTGAKVVKGRRAAKLPDGAVEPSSVNESIKGGLGNAQTMLNLFTYELTTAIYETALVRETGAQNADAREDEDSAFLCMLMSHVTTGQFAMEDRALVIHIGNDSATARPLAADYCSESVKSMQFKLAHLMALPESDDVARYAADLFEERASWRLRRAAKAPGMPAEALDAYCEALRAELRAYLSGGRLLAQAGPATTLIASGKSAGEIVAALESPPPHRAFPRVSPPRPPKTPKARNVAILNFVGGANYGANLTAYALAKAVEKEGFHPYLVNRRFMYYPKIHTDDRFLAFGERHMHWTRPCYGREHYKLLNRHFDTFIVGSDQVWAYQPTWLFSKPVQMRDVFDLEFSAPGKRRIAMAASFGEYNYHKAPKEFCSARAAALARFAAISVREAGGVDICRDYLQAQALHVLDPVFLLNGQEWGRLADESSLRLPAAYIAVSCLHAPLVPYADSAALHLAHERGWACRNIMEGSVQDWLKSIRNSSLVITDSFHVGCFAIIFRRPVVFLVNSSRGKDRIPSLVNTLGISTPLFMEDAISMSPSTFLRQVGELPQECTDYSSLKLASAIQTTADFLHRALHSPIPEGADAIPIDKTKIHAERRAFMVDVGKSIVHNLPRYLYHRARGIFQKRFLPRAARERAILRQAYTRFKL